jgi:hypothetical protein
MALWRFSPRTVYGDSRSEWNDHRESLLPGSTDRAKEPLTYWMVLVTQYLGGAFLVWHWLTHYR